MCHLSPNAYIFVLLRYTFFTKPIHFYRVHNYCLWCKKQLSTPWSQKPAPFSYDGDSHRCHPSPAPSCAVLFSSKVHCVFFCRGCGWCCGNRLSHFVCWPEVKICICLINISRDISHYYEKLAVEYQVILIYFFLFVVLFTMGLHNILYSKHILLFPCGGRSYFCVISFIVISMSLYNIMYW